MKEWYKKAFINNTSISTRLFRFCKKRKDCRVELYNYVSKDMWINAKVNP